MNSRNGKSYQLIHHSMSLWWAFITVISETGFSFLTRCIGQTIDASPAHAALQCVAAHGNPVVNRLKSARKNRPPGRRLSRFNPDGSYAHGPRPRLEPLTYASGVPQPIDAIGSIGALLALRR